MPSGLKRRNLLRTVVLLLVFFSTFSALYLTSTGGRVSLTRWGSIGLNVRQE
jgi:hypothetical protein